MHSRCCWPPERLRPLALSLSLTSSHSAARRSAVSTRPSSSDFEQLLVEPDAEGDVLVDRHRERRRLLEHHADARAQQVEILLGRQDVLAVEQHLALGALVRIEIVHPVEDAQQRRLAAARRADEGGDLAGVERQADVLQRLAVAVEEVEVADRDPFLQPGGIDRRVGDGDGTVRRCDIHDCFLGDESARAMMLSASTVKVMISAPVQASACQSL